MPSERQSLPKPSIKHTLHPSAAQQQQEENLPPVSDSLQRVKNLLHSPAFTAQRQLAAVQLGRISGNFGLEKILSRLPIGAIQRQVGDEGTEESTDADTASTAEGEVGVAMDAVVSAILEDFLESFSNIPVTVHWSERTDGDSENHAEQVTFHPPYFMNVFDRNEAAASTLTRYDTAIRERGAADRAIRNFIREFSRSERRGGWGMGRALVGKSTPEEIQSITQGALDQGLIPTPTGENFPNGEAIRGWLQRYGIGVDCSGFVSQALNLAAERVLGRDLTAAETLSTNARGLTGGARGFSRIDDISNLRPGDTMGIPGHIRIITHVTTDESGSVVFTTAESRAGGADVGPDRGEWRYQGETLQVRRSPTEEWSNTDEHPTFGRYNLLESARTTAVAE